ncbi:MAG TPA: hypothetical protein VGI39_27475 [Polyangiaceae bacterium]|jgi:high-affinity nickel-transport protein
MFGVVLGYLFGVLHGMRHALEPDHVAAVGAMVAEQRSARASMRFAVAWGAGHAVTLFLVGGVLFAFRKKMPAGVGDAFELAVAIMLVALGVRALVSARPNRPSAHAHAHAPHGWSSTRRPLLVGLVHGLAGSGALAAMVMSELSTLASGLVFMALYGLGATCGMAALAGVAGVPLAHLARKPRVLPALVATAGVFSMGLGFVWGAPIVARFAAG